MAGSLTGARTEKYVSMETIALFDDSFDYVAPLLGKKYSSIAWWSSGEQETRVSNHVSAGHAMLTVKIEWLTAFSQYVYIRDMVTL